jgi:hypothetical protein
LLLDDVGVVVDLSAYPETQLGQSPALDHPAPSALDRDGFLRDGVDGLGHQAIAFEGLATAGHYVAVVPGPPRRIVIREFIIARLDCQDPQQEPDATDVALLVGGL